MISHDGFLPSCLGDQYASKIVAEILLLVAVRIRPRSCSAGTSPSSISASVRAPVALGSEKGSVAAHLLHQLAQRAATAAGVLKLDRQVDRHGSSPSSRGIERPFAMRLYCSRFCWWPFGHSGGHGLSRSNLRHRYWSLAKCGDLSSIRSIAIAAASSCAPGHLGLVSPRIGLMNRAPLQSKVCGTHHHVLVDVVAVGASSPLDALYMDHNRVGMGGGRELACRAERAGAGLVEYCTALRRRP